MFDEEERKASEEYIQRLLAEEEQLLQAERRRREEDEKMARLLNDQLVCVRKEISILTDIAFYVSGIASGLTKNRRLHLYLFVYLCSCLANGHLVILVLQNSAAITQENSRPADITPAKRKKEVNAGQIER